MKRTIDSIDSDSHQYGYYRRLFGNAVAIALGDAFIVALALVFANSLLWMIHYIPFSIRNGFLIVPAWTVMSLTARILPGWGLGPVDELRKIQYALFILYTVILIVSFIAGLTLASSRIVFLFSYIYCAVGLPLMRAWLCGLLHKMGLWGIPVSIYGNVSSIKSVEAALGAEPYLGYIPAAIFSDEVPVGSDVNGVPVLGHLGNVTHRTPVAVVALGESTRHQLIETLEGPLEVYRRVIVIPDLQEAPSLWVMPRDLQGVLGLEIKKNLLNPVAKVFKRSMDLSIIILSMPLWVPLMTVLYVLILLEDRKNPLFLQPRLGRGGGVFRTVKFRTMVPNAETVLSNALDQDPDLRAEWEAHYKLRKDPRITRVGRFLRRTSLDEIPQILNVLRGTMSLVGPRPLPPYHYNDLPEQVRFLRDKVQPGITGMWQVSGRSESGTAGMEKWDPYYVRNWSIWLDLVIIFRTIKVVLSAKGAY